LVSSSQLSLPAAARLQREAPTEAMEAPEVAPEVAEVGQEVALGLGAAEEEDRERKMPHRCPRWGARRAPWTRAMQCKRTHRVFFAMTTDTIAARLGKRIRQPPAPT
jgi:hypothetical protein